MVDLNWEVRRIPAPRSEDFNVSDLATPQTDLVREIRLRQWARRHFVPIDVRKSTWHPIVLDEMRRRDQEVANETAAVMNRDGV